MPKSTKLHSKGKSTTFQKPCKLKSDSPEDKGNLSPEEVARQFQLELVWCIQQLERSLKDKKESEKQAIEAWKVLTVLKKNDQPMIRKRQLMRTHFGDYRAKMAAEEKKLAKMASKIKISDVPANPKATYLRKSIFSTTGDNSFRFNFESESISENETKSSEKEPAYLDKKPTVQPLEESEVNKTGNIKDSNIVNNNNPKTFKFQFTNSKFKFNFKSDDVSNENK